MTPTQLGTSSRGDVRDEASRPLDGHGDLRLHGRRSEDVLPRRWGHRRFHVCDLHPCRSRRGHVHRLRPRILKLRDLRRASDGRNVSILNFEDLGHPGWAFQDDYGQSTSFGTGGVKFNTNPTAITGVVEGMDANKAPSGMAPQWLTTRSKRSSTACPRRHHRFLNRLRNRRPAPPVLILNWMKHLAHEKQDAGLTDRGRSISFAISSGVLRSGKRPSASAASTNIAPSPTAGL